MSLQLPSPAEQCAASRAAIYCSNSVFPSDRVTCCQSARACFEVAAALDTSGVITCGDSKYCFSQWSVASGYCVQAPDGYVAGIFPGAPSTTAAPTNVPAQTQTANTGTSNSNSNSNANSAQSTQDASTSNGGSSSGDAVKIAVPIVVIVISLLLAGFFFYKWRQSKSKEPKGEVEKVAGAVGHGGHQRNASHVSEVYGHSYLNAVELPVLPVEMEGDYPATMPLKNNIETVVVPVTPTSAVSPVSTITPNTPNTERPDTSDDGRPELLGRTRSS
ncbi:hypothetical protein FPQ18DRAFT_346333 [Pyronema domesticum]|uniref:Uncharacterized protein n=1 Tax=Pyronema omphalodes (strain CBS 100304) TaxID=1076935 RepID=U4L294_PYROM|nr:hypothetical protein FPQ18DRAFT_346333 [Pyronema domesticum]CCX06393.1 Protein of unknown function [Pyronema omphalodes CBS 100304]